MVDPSSAGRQAPPAWWGLAESVLAAMHTACGLGPSLPFLPYGGRNVPVLAMDYPTDARQDRYVRRWKALAKDIEGA